MNSHPTRMKKRRRLINIDSVDQGKGYMRNILAFIGMVAVLVCAGAAAIFFGGYYDVGTTAWEPPIVRWALISVREASVRRHAGSQPTLNLADPVIIRTGARVYLDRGCVNCHGGPGVTWAKFSEGLRPDPADLKEIALERSPSEIFWVLKNGINMTGMPGFGAATDQDLWAIVAFVKKMPEVNDDDFKAWSSQAGEVPKP